MAAILKEARDYTKPGIATGDIDRFVGRLCLKYGVKPAFRGYNGFPANICTSLNDEIVHGLPSDKRVIHSGDLVSLDFGVLYRGFNTDAAITFSVGKANATEKKLIKVVQKSFFAGMKKVRAGAHLGDVSEAIQKYIEKEGFAVIRNLAGHGIGKEIHEYPVIPNFGKKGTGDILKEGMVLAIEPMIAEKGFELKLDTDGWTYITADGGLSAHFEHTICVTKRGYEILTQ